MLRSLVLASFAVFAAGVAPAAEIKVMAALAARLPLDPIAADFARASGHRVEIAYSTVGAIRHKLAAGERADVIVAPVEAIAAMEKEGLALPGSPGGVATTKVGVAIRAGTTVPDVSTLEALKTALLSARVAYTDPKSGGFFGTQFAAMLERIGIADAVNKTAVLRGGSHEVAASVLKGEADLGVTFISTIVSTPGLVVAGSLPPPLASAETFGAGVLAVTSAREPASAFVASLGSQAARATWTRTGFELASGAH